MEGGVIRPEFDRSHLISEAITQLRDYHRIMSMPNITMSDEYRETLEDNREAALAPLTDDERLAVEEALQSERDEQDTEKRVPIDPYGMRDDLMRKVIEIKGE